MSKKPKKNLGESKKNTGLVQKIFLMAMRATGKAKAEANTVPISNDTPENEIELSGSKWVLGCSSGAAADIAAMQDRGEEYPSD
jgi:hypothetical protein